MSELVLDVWKTGPPPKDGQFQRLPSRFWHCFSKAYPEYVEKVYKPKGKEVQVTLADDVKILHMFSGEHIDWGDTTDIRPESNAKIIAPYDNLPILDNTYHLVVADPPYADFFAEEWTDPKNFPKPKRILVEGARVTKPGGIIAILHIIKPRNWKEANCDWIGGHSILCGDNNTVRFLSVFRKREGE